MGVVVVAEGAPSTTGATASTPASWAAAATAAAKAASSVVCIARVSQCWRVSVGYTDAEGAEEDAGGAGSNRG